MELMKRWTTLLKADAHGMVDALEDPSRILRQNLRDARTEVLRKRCRLQALEAEERDLLAENRHLEGRIEELERDIELALAKDEETLARASIKKLLPVRRRQGQVARRREALERERGELAERLSQQEVELADLEQRVRGYLAQGQEPDGVGRDLWDAWTVTEEDIDMELLHRRHRPRDEGGV